MSEAPRKSNYKPRGEVISNEENYSRKQSQALTLSDKRHKASSTRAKIKKNTEKENKNTNKQRTKPQRKSPEKSNAHSKKRKRAERYICEIYHASG